MLFKNIKTVDRDLNVLKNMYVLTEGKFIKYIGTECPENYTGEVIDGTNKFLMPGFYNTHCHVPMTLPRGIGEGLPLDRWLTERIFPFEARLTYEDVYYGAMLGAMELLASGVVSITDMYLKCPGYLPALGEIGIKCNICNGLMEFNPDGVFENNIAVKETLQMMDMAKYWDDRIRVDMGLHAEYTSFERVVRETAEFAKANGLNIHTHVSETAKEHEECKERHNGMTPVEYLEYCGAFDVPLTAAHCIWVEPHDIEIMAAHGATMAHNITSNLKIGSGIAPIRKLMDGGVNVTIATDGASSNNNLNYMEEMHIGALVVRGANLDANIISVKDTFRMATVNGAASQQRYDSGIMEEGARADLVMFDLDKPHLTPDYDTLTNILFSAQAADVCMTMVDGRVLYRNGEFPGIDTEKIKAEVASRQTRILGELNLANA